MKFNYIKFFNNNVFNCIRCGSSNSFSKISSGCPSCGYHLLKISQRGNTPRAWDPDREDPYLRQHRGPMDSNNKGFGYKLTTPGDEEHGGGFGSRWRGKGPGRYSEKEGNDDYRVQDDLPSEHTLIDEAAEGGRAEDVHNVFVDPSEPLSRAQEINRDMAGLDKGSLEDNLRSVNNKSRSLKNNDSNSIFENTIKRQKGIWR